MSVIVWNVIASFLQGSVVHYLSEVDIFFMCL